MKDASLVRMFLMMQPWYIPSTDMAKKLVLKYPSCLFPAASEMYYVFFGGHLQMSLYRLLYGLDEERFLVCFSLSIFIYNFAESCSKVAP